MTGPRPGDPCEGACGCRLLADENGYSCEVTDEPPIPGDAEWEEHAIGDEHTPERCVAIRSLREAGNDGAGRDGGAAVAISPGLLLVMAWDGHGQWAQAPVAERSVIGVTRAALDDVAAQVAAVVRAVFRARVSDYEHLRYMPIIAYNPASRR